MTYPLERFKTCKFVYAHVLVFLVFLLLFVLFYFLFLLFFLVNASQ